MLWREHSPPQNNPVLYKPGQALCAKKRKYVAAHRTRLFPSLLCCDLGAQPRDDFQLCVRNGCGNNMIGPWSGNAGSELPHPRATCAAETPHNRKPKKLGIWCSWHWLQQAYTGWKVWDDTSLTRPHLEAINELRDALEQTRSLDAIYIEAPCVPESRRLDHFRTLPACQWLPAAATSFLPVGAGNMF